MCHNMCMQVRGQPYRVGSLLPFTWVSESQACVVSALPMELSVYWGLVLVTFLLLGQRTTTKAAHGIVFWGLRISEASTHLYGREHGWQAGVLLEQWLAVYVSSTPLRQMEEGGDNWEWRGLLKPQTGDQAF